MISSTGLSVANWKKQAILFVLILAVGFTWLYWSESGNWALRVNGEKIARAELDTEVALAEDFLIRTYGFNLEGTEAEKLHQQIEEAALQQLVDQALLKQAAKWHGLEVGKSEVDFVISMEEQQMGGAEQFKKTLSERNLTMAAYQARIKSALSIQKLWEHLTAQVTVDELELKNIYSAQREQFTNPEETKIGCILLNSEETAVAVINALNAGADFQETAVKYSQDPGVSQNKGIIGYVKKDDPLYPQSLLQEAFSLPVGGFSQKPVESELGYFVVKVFEKREAGVLAYEEVKDSLREEVLAQKKNDLFLEYLEGLRQKARVNKKI